MEVYRRNNSPFWWYDGTVDGKRVRASTKVRADESSKRALATSKRLAEEAAEALVEAAQAADDPASGITLGDALDRYTAYLEAHNKASADNVKTLRDKLLGLGRFAAAGRYAMRADTPLVDLSPIDMERLVTARLAEGNGPQTASHEVKMVRAAVRYAAGLGFPVPPAMTAGFVKNPWRMPKVPQKTRYLSWEEWEKVYAWLSPDRPIMAGTRKGGVGKPYLPTGAKLAARQEVQDLLVALTMTGGRWSEVKTLTWARVDMANRRVRIFGTKDNEERLAPMPDQFKEVLQRRLAGPSESPLVFPSPRHGGERGGTCKALLRAMDACGLNDPETVARYGKATVHSLRHTFASWLLQNGGDLAEVQDALGHAGVAMTRRYAHLAKGKTATRLGGILSGVGGQQTQKEVA